MPVLHFGFHQLGALDLTLRPAREATVTVTMVLLGLLAWVERRQLQRERSAGGTGLGLTTVFGFAAQSGGALDVKSERGMGTTVFLRLPLFDGPPPDSEARQAEAPADDARGSILLVEDEEQVRTLVLRVLESRGYRVTAASSVAEARERLDELDSGIDLLLTDMVLKTGTGLDFARQLRSEMPELPALLISGYTAESLNPRVLAAEKGYYLGKPFTPDKLLSKVRAVLDGHAES